MTLTKKQELFCKEYVKHDDKSKAYRIAYSAKNMKAETIHARACELSKNSKVAVRIAELQKVTADVAKKHFQIDSKEILGHLNILRNARIDQFVNYAETELKDEDGNIKKFMQLQFKPFDQLTEEQLMCIKSVKNGRYGIEMEIHGVDWTIEKIAKHIGFYEKDNNQKKAPAFVVYDGRKKEGG